MPGPFSRCYVHFSEIHRKYYTSNPFSSEAMSSPTTVTVPQKSPSGRFQVPKDRGASFYRWRLGDSFFSVIFRVV